MKKIYLLLVLMVGWNLAAMSMDYEALADTLTVIAQSKARLGSVRVTNVRVKNESVFVTTNPALSQVSFSPEEVTQMRQLVSELVLGHKRGKVTITTGDYEIGELVTSVYKSRGKKDHYVLPATRPWVENISLPYDVNRGLQGYHLALWGSHGRYYLQSQETWKWQRAKLWTTVEDVYTTSYTMCYLVPMLENAGAVVVQPRERDTQTDEAIVDDTEATATGDWQDGEEAMGWGRKGAPLLEEENPFRMGSYRHIVTDKEGTAVLRYTPKLDGPRNSDQYAVYVSYKTLPNSTNAALYTVVHKGQKTQFKVNQQMGGGTWVYLGTFAFDADHTDANYVEVVNVGNGKTELSADAVKFGGGYGSVARYQQPDLIVPTTFSQDWTRNDTMVIDSAVLRDNISRATTSGFPRWLEGSRYWLQYAGIPDSVYSYTRHKNDYTDDYSSRGRWVNFLSGGSAANPKQEGLGVPLCFSLAFHTDAGSIVRDRMIGTLQIYTDHDNEGNKVFPNGVSRQLNRDVSDFIQTQLCHDLAGTGRAPLTRRQLNNASYAESRYPLVPSTLIELLSHQNQYDMVWGLDPRVKFAISRAIYKGILRFQCEQKGVEAVIQPLPVSGMRIDRVADDLQITWKATPDTLEETATPTYYIVYTRKDNGDWDNGVKVTSSSYRFTPQKGVSYDFYVAAGNAGGISMPSETLSAYLAQEEKGMVLIVNGFDRVSGPDWTYDSLQVGIRPDGQAVGNRKEVAYIGEQFQFDPLIPWTSDDNSGWGECYSDQQTEVTAGNSFAYPMEHGKVLRQMGYSYVSAGAGGLDSIGKYALVDLILGKQRTYVLGTDTSFHCFPTALQSLLKDYLAHNGRLLLSGSYIASDMRQGADADFVHHILHYGFRNQHASRSGKVYVERGLPVGAQWSFDMYPQAAHLWNENPDGLIPTEGGQYIARYADSGMGAAIGFDGLEEGKGKILSWGFMLESSREFEALYEASLQWVMMGER